MVAFNDRRPNFGANWDPPTITPARPAKNYSYRAGTEKKLQDPERDVHGQMYAFRPTTDNERGGHESAERLRVSKEHNYARHWTDQANDRLWATSLNRYGAGSMGGAGFGGTPDASHWPQPAATAQHGDYTLAHYPGHLRGVAAFHGDQPVARLQLARMSNSEHDPRMYVGMIETDDAHRRKGIARAMWEFGQKQTGGNLLQSVERTPNGEAFARAVGGHDTLGRNLGRQFEGHV